MRIAGSSISLCLLDAARCSIWMLLRDASAYDVDAFLTLPGCVFELRSIDSQRHKRVDGRNRARARGIIANAINERAASLRSPRFVVSFLVFSPEGRWFRHSTGVLLDASAVSHQIAERLANYSTEVSDG